MKYCLFAYLSLAVLPMMLSEARAENIFQVYQDAQQHSLENGIQLANYRSTQASSAQAKSGLKPTVELSASAKINNQLLLDTDRPAGADNAFNYADAEYNVRWSKPLFDQQAQGSIATANAQEAQALIALDNQPKELLLTVAEQYFKALKVQAKLDSSQQEQQYLEEQLGDTRKGYDAGAFSQVDLAEVEAQHALNLSEIQDTQAQLLAAKQALELLTQRNYATLATPLAGWLPDKVAADAKTAEAITQENNAKVNMLRQNLAVAKEKAKQVYANASSQLNLVAKHSGQVVAGDSFNQHNQFDTSIGAEFKMDFDTNQAVFFESQAMRQQEIAAELALAAGLEKNVQDTRNLYNQLDNNRQQMPLQKKAIEASQKAVELTRQGFVAGVRTADDYFLAIKRLSKTKLDYEYARYDHILDTLQLKASLGSLSASDLQQLSQHMR